MTETGCQLSPLDIPACAVAGHRLAANAFSFPLEEIAMPEPEHIDRHRAALIAYDVCQRALTPADPARRAAMRPVLDAWVQMIATARAAGMPVIYTTPVSRADGADVVMLPTDLSAETGVPPLTNGIEGSPEAGFPDEIAPWPEDYVFLKRRPSAFYGTGVAELLHMLRRDTIIIGGGATNRGVETSVREAFNLDLASCRSARVLLERRPGRPRLQPRQGDEDVRAHPQPRSGQGDAAGMTDLPRGGARRPGADRSPRSQGRRGRRHCEPMTGCRALRRAADGLSCRTVHKGNSHDSHDRHACPLAARRSRRRPARPYQGTAHHCAIRTASRC